MFCNGLKRQLHNFLWSLLGKAWQWRTKRLTSKENFGGVREANVGSWGPLGIMKSATPCSAEMCFPEYRDPWYSYASAFSFPEHGVVASWLSTGIRQARGTVTGLTRTLLLVQWFLWAGGPSGPSACSEQLARCPARGQWGAAGTSALRCTHNLSEQLLYLACVFPASLLSAMGKEEVLNPTGRLPGIAPAFCLLGERQQCLLLRD